MKLLAWEQEKMRMDGDSDGLWAEIIKLCKGGNVTKRHIKIDKTSAGLTVLQWARTALWVLKEVNKRDNTWDVSGVIDAAPIFLDAIPVDGHGLSGPQSTTVAELRLREKIEWAKSHNSGVIVVGVEDAQIMLNALMSAEEKKSGYETLESLIGMRLNILTTMTADLAKSVANLLKDQHNHRSGEQ